MMTTGIAHYVGGPRDGETEAINLTQPPPDINFPTNDGTTLEYHRRGLGINGPKGWVAYYDHQPNRTTS